MTYYAKIGGGAYEETDNDEAMKHFEKASTESPGFCLADTMHLAALADVEKGGDRDRKILFLEKWTATCNKCGADSPEITMMKRMITDRGMYMPCDTACSDACAAEGQQEKFLLWGAVFVAVALC